MVVYYINKSSESLADYRYPIKEGDICMLYDGEVIKTIYIDSERDTDSIWRDFKFIDTKSLKSYQFPTSDSILCAPIGEKHAIGNTGLLTQLIQECKGEWLLDFLNETSSILSGFVDYWDLEVLKRLTGDNEVDITYEEEYTISEFIDRSKEDDEDNNDDVEDIDTIDDDEYTEFLPKSNDIKWFCLSALTCIEDQLDKRACQILYDTLRGESRKSIAQKHKLTQERIRQIVVKATKQAKELLIEQRSNLEKIKSENERQRLQLNLLKEQVAELKALVPKEVQPSYTGDENDFDTELAELLEIPLKDIRLPVRAFNTLDNMGIKKFADIPMIESKEKVLERKNSGWKTVHDISRMLEDFQLSIGMSFKDVFDILKTYDWHAAKKKWIRENERNEEIIEPLLETKDEESSISNIKDSSCVDGENKSSQEFIIDNKQNRCYIINNQGERVFSSDGELIRLNGIFYKINYTDSFVSMNIIQEDGKGKFSYGRRILSVKYRSPLYGRLDKRNYLTQFKAVKYDDSCDEYYIQVDDRWYGSSGYYADINRSDNILTTNVASASETEIIIKNEEPSVDNLDSSSEALEVEHVFLDRLGNVIEKKNSSSFDIPETGFAKENRRGKPWTNNEEELIALYFRQGKDAATIAEIVGRTEVSIKSRLGLLGLIDYKYGQESETANRPENSNSSKQDNTEIPIDYSKFSVKIGDMLRLLPSQLVGEVIRLHVDNKGYRKIIVETMDKELIEIYDNQYLYEKISSRKVTTQRSRPRVNVNDSISLEPKKKCKADIGKWIRWKPTSDVGKVVGFKSLGSLQKLVLRRKDGSEIEVYDNPKAYEIIM